MAVFPVSDQALRHADRPSARVGQLNRKQIAALAGVAPFRCEGNGRYGEGAASSGDLVRLVAAGKQRRWEA